MGKYVNHTSKGEINPSAGQKCQAILDDGGIEVPSPTTFVENLVCVVDNGWFGAAAYAYSESEMKDFQNPNDVRPTRWFVWDKVKKYATELQERMIESNERLVDAQQGVANALMFALSVEDGENGELIINKDNRELLSKTWSKNEEQ